MHDVCTYSQCSYPDCSRQEAASDVIFGMFVGPSIANKAVKLYAGLNRCQKIQLQVVADGIVDGKIQCFVSARSWEYMRPAHFVMDNNNDKKLSTESMAQGWHFASKELSSNGQLTQNLFSLYTNQYVTCVRILESNT